MSKIKEYLVMSKQGDYAEVYQFIQKEINELEDIQLILTVNVCCDNLLSAITKPETMVLLGQKIAIKIIRDEEDNRLDFYVYYKGDNKELVDVFNSNDHYILDHFHSYFNDNIIANLYEIFETIDFKLNFEGVEKLRSALMGKELISKYLNAKLELEVPDKPKGKQQKI